MCGNGAAIGTATIITSKTVKASAATRKAQQKVTTPKNLPYPSGWYEAAPFFAMLLIAPATAWRHV